MKIINGDALTELRKLPEESCNMCVTSPPYWGLRDYGVKGQLGLEKTLEEYISKMVEIFREVKRVLRSDGILFLNLGDSYVGSGKGYGDTKTNNKDNLHSRKVFDFGRQGKSSIISRVNRGRTYAAPNIKAKDLCMMPARVAMALQAPYYTGRIKEEKDRIWLAAMIDGEGCVFIHKRKKGTHHDSFKKKDGTISQYKRSKDMYGAGLEVANTQKGIVEKCLQITGIGSICEQSPNQNPRRKQIIYRWNVRSNECKWIIQEVYPHLVGKKHEVRLVLGCPSSGIEAEKAHISLMSLHNGKDACIDFPEPKSMYEPGYYLRQDIIWSKKNCMPESVNDRCTKSHEYIFLLSKNRNYYYDADAIKEPASHNTHERVARAKDSHKRNKIPGQKPSQFSRTPKAQTVPAGWNTGPGRHDTITGRYPKIKNNSSFDAPMSVMPDTRNKRSVWTIATQPFPEAHFATFPEALIKPCIMAGCPERGIVLDPFLGSGTTALVSRNLNRDCIGIEINPDYIKIINNRLAQQRAAI